MPSPSIIAGRYEIRGTLRRGAMGTVHDAVNLVTGRRVALKILEGAARQSERLLREARAAGQLESRHIAQVLDAGVDEGRAFLVLELLRGADLAAVLARVGSVDAHLALRIVGQACSGLRQAHAAGILHRDIKPANLFVAREEEQLVVKILDFGVAKGLTPDALGDVGRRSLTADRALVGTPLYMSPEQARSAKSIDGRSDLWSLGVVLYELLTGRTPHEEQQSLGEIILAICGRRIRIADRAADVPHDVAAIVDRALDLDPSHRFQSAEEMVSAIRAILGSSWDIAASELERAVARPIYDGATLSADAPNAGERVRTLTLASSQVVVEAAVRGDYLLAIVHGRMSTREDAHASNQFLIEALESSGVRRILMDARRADGTKQGHAGLWDWILEGRAFERFAMLVESPALRRGFDAQAAEHRANARAFEDLAEAEAWLRSIAR